MQAVVVADHDEALARSTAMEIASMIWERRREFTLRMEHYPVREGLLKAAASDVRPTYVTDSGDNVSAGAGGDLTFVLQDVLDTPLLDDVIVAGIFAPHTVDQCRAAGVGAKVALELGAEHASAPKKLRRVEALVEALGDALHIATPADPSSSTPRTSKGAWARVRFGKVTATFHAVRLYISTPSHLQAMGIDPTSHKVYVVKLGYLMPQLEDIAARHILLLSEGAANMEFDRLTWSQISRPAFPMDPDATWDPSNSVFSSSQ